MTSFKYDQQFLGCFFDGRIELLRIFIVQLIYFWKKISFEFYRSLSGGQGDQYCVGNKLIICSVCGPSIREQLGVLKVTLKSTCI